MLDALSKRGENATVLPTYYDADLPPGLLTGKTVGIIGYGSQGRAQALNLRSNGHDVRIGLRAGSRSQGKAVADGFNVVSVADATLESSVLMLLAPDEHHAAIFENDVRPNLARGSAVGFAHGFSVHYKQLEPPKDVDIFLAAPKGAGPLLRREFERGGGIPCLIAVHQDATGRAKSVALGYAQAIGGGRAGILETTFREECETDLFGEQAVLCGGVSSLIRTAFETLVEAGYPPELAYFECLHELKFTVDLIHEHGLAGMRGGISSTAKYGDLTRGPRIIDDGVKARMKDVLEEITSGRFTEEWVLECKVGRPVLTTLLARATEHAIESVGARLRSMMAWLPRNKD